MYKRRTAKIKTYAVQMLAPLDGGSADWCERCNLPSEYISQAAAIESIRDLRARGLVADLDRVHMFQSGMTILVCRRSIGPSAAIAMPDVSLEIAAVSAPGMDTCRRHADNSEEFRLIAAEI